MRRSFGHKLIAGFLAVWIIVLPSGCTFHDKATTYNGMTDHDGKTVTHIITEKWGLDLLCGFGGTLHGDGTLEGAMDAMTAEAAADGAKRVRVVGSGTKMLWYVLFPFSLIITPRISTVHADTMK